jgi:TPR repeat protein
VTYFDKLIQVPLLNLSVPLLDFIGRRLPLEKLKLNLEIPTVRYAFLGLWIPVFLFGFLPGMADHPGRRVGFWSDKCDASMAAADHKGDPAEDPFCRNLSMFLRDSCTAGRVTPPDDCNLLGTMYEDGVGVPRNDAYAARLHEKACEGGLPVACSDLGLMVLEGRGGPANPQLALDLFKRACDEGAPDGCQNYGAVLGQRSAGDPQRIAEAKTALVRAATLYTQACEAGDKEACQRIEEIKAGNRAPPSEQP